MTLLLIKASVLLAAAIGATRLIAGRRHLLWSAAFAGLMLLPVLGLVLPPIEISSRSRASALAVLRARLHR